MPSGRVSHISPLLTARKRVHDRICFPATRPYRIGRERRRALLAVGLFHRLNQSGNHFEKIAAEDYRVPHSHNPNIALFDAGWPSWRASMETCPRW